MSRLDDLRDRQERRKSQLGFSQDNQDADRDQVRVKVNSGRKLNRRLIVIFSSVLLLSLILTILFLQFGKKSLTDNDKAVGLIVLTPSVESLFEMAMPWVFDENEYERSGNQVHIPFGTAFSIGQGLFASNAHVTEVLKEFISEGGSAYIKLNKSVNEIYPITTAISHPKYAQERLNEYDVGLIRVSGDVKHSLQLEKRKKIEKLKAGEKVSYIGFPMENLSKNGINLSSPVATIQSGIITSISDYDYKLGSNKSNYLVRHNMGATGGASGSPLINDDGRVVAVLNGISLDVSDVNFDQTSSEEIYNPSAAMINYAQRADLIYQTLDTFSNF